MYARSKNTEANMLAHMFLLALFVSKLMSADRVSLFIKFQSGPPCTYQHCVTVKLFTDIYPFLGNAFLSVYGFQKTSDPLNPQSV